MSTETYSVGQQCEALWAEDGKHTLPLCACASRDTNRAGKHYPAEVLSVFKRKDVEMCRVKFMEYDDEAEVLVSDLKPLAKPQRVQKHANGKSATASASPAPRLQAASASASATPPASSAASNGANATTPKTPGAKTPKAAPAAAAAPSDLDSELKRLQAEMRAKEAEDKQEKEAALAEMKALSEKLMLEGYARQVALLDLRAREDRVKQQLALLSKSFAAFSSKDSSSSSPHAAASASPAASANHDAADVPRCIEAIKKIQAKIHGGANEGILVSALGLALNPKLLQVNGPLKQFLSAHPQHFEVIVSDGPSSKGMSTVASVRLR